MVGQCPVDRWPGAVSDEPLETSGPQGADPGNDSDLATGGAGLVLELETTGGGVGEGPADHSGLWPQGLAAGVSGDPEGPGAGLTEAEAEERLSTWAKNQSELAKAIGCDRKSIQRWMKERDPECPGTTADGRYNVSLWRLWTEKKGKRQQGRLGNDKGSLELAYMKLKNEKLEIENMLRRGDLMHADEVNKVLGEMMGAFVQRLRAVKHTLAPSVVGVSMPEATKRIGREVDDVLTELALGEWAKKKPFWGTVYAALLDLHKTHNLGAGQSVT